MNLNKKLIKYFLLLSFIITSTVPNATNAMMPKEILPQVASSAYDRAIKLINKIAMCPKYTSLYEIIDLFQN